VMQRLKAVVSTAAHKGQPGPDAARLAAGV